MTMTAKRTTTTVHYVETRDRFMPNMAIGIYKGEGKQRELVAAVPLVTWQSPRPIGGNVMLPANRPALSLAEDICAFLNGEHEGLCR